MLVAKYRPNAIRQKRAADCHDYYWLGSQSNYSEYHVPTLAGAWEERLKWTLSTSDSSGHGGWEVCKVKLMWPREEDFTRDQYPPMAYVHAQAGLDGSSNITALAYRNISPSILGQRGVVLGQIGDSQGSEGSNKLPYNIGSRFIEWVSHPSPIPV